MINSKEVKPNDIIQLTENAHEDWVACLMVVSEVKSWGVLAYTKIPCKGDAYLRVPFEQFEIAGHAILVHPEFAEMSGEDF